MACRTVFQPIAQLHSMARVGARMAVSPLIESSSSNFPISNVCCVSIRSYCMQQIFQKPFESTILKMPLAKYGGRQTVTVLPGDGIGPEMLAHVKRLCITAQVPVDFEDIQLDSRQTIKTWNEDLENAIISIERNGVALKGNIETKFNDPTVKSRNVELRVRLDLYANVLWCKSIPGIPAKHSNVDIIMIRENTEGEYSGIEHETVPGVVESLKIVTKYNIERIAKFAFDYATKYKRKKVTAIHKANIMKIGDGLFLRVCEEVAAGYPHIKFDNMIIDNASMQLVSKPHQFDVMLMPNLYGNIVSNIGCGLVGGPGLVSGINLGDKYAVFETGTRNTGTSLVGQDAANPTAFIRALIDMLYFLGIDKHAKLINDSLMKVLTVDRIHTSDIGGTAKASDFVTAVDNEIKSRMQHW